MKFPKDVAKSKVIKTFEKLGFRLVRVANHIAMIRENPDKSNTPLTLPNHDRIKGSTLRMICTQANITREDFLKFYEDI